MSFRSITPQQAADLLATSKGAVYLDVRSEAEFAAGHPEGAVNIPVAEPDPRSGQMAFNPEFQLVVEKTFPRDAVLAVGCLSGKRSEMACGVLEGAGYTNLANVVGGFGGVKDSAGRIIKPGWKDSGLSVSTENGEGVSYASLRRRAKGASSGRG